MITKAEKLAFVVAEYDKRPFHVDTMEFFENNPALYNSFNSVEEGLVDGMFRAFAYMEKREQERRDRCIDDCVAQGEFL